MAPPKPGWTYCPQCGFDVPDPIYQEFCIKKEDA